MKAMKRLELLRVHPRPWRVQEVINGDTHIRDNDNNEVATPLPSIHSLELAFFIVDCVNSSYLDLEERCF